MCDIQGNSLGLNTVTFLSWQLPCACQTGCSVMLGTIIIITTIKHSHSSRSLCVPGISGITSYALSCLKHHKPYAAGPIIPVSKMGKWSSERLNSLPKFLELLKCGAAWPTPSLHSWVLPNTYVPNTVMNTTHSFGLWPSALALGDTLQWWKEHQCRSQADLSLNPSTITDIIRWPRASCLISWASLSISLKGRQE